MDYELSVSRFADLMAWTSENVSDGNRTEASVRFHLIDQTLTSCLGWAIEEITPEAYHLGEFSDYELGNPSKRLLIEAKREGVYFDLPSGLKKLKYKIHTVFDFDSAVKSAMLQAMAYCQKRGIELGAVSNGTQYIIFIGARTDGIPPDLGDCFVFDSLEAIRDNYREFWNFLSFDGTKERKAINSLRLLESMPAPEKLSRQIIDYPGFKNRNPIAAELQVLGGLFLEDIARLPEFEEDFIKETYCEAGAFSQYAYVSKQILRTRYNSYFEKEAKVSVKPVRTKKGIDPDLHNDLLAAGMSRRPIILVGDVGVGKSMFIKHLIHVDAKDILDKSIVLYLDFGNKPSLVTEISPFVISELERQLLAKYGIDIFEDAFVRGVYDSDLARFSKGIYKTIKLSSPQTYEQKETDFLSEKIADHESHLKSCISHIVFGRKKQVVIFLDNVDQRPIEFQEQVFLIGQSLAETWPVTVFIALRPDTFMHSRASGYLAAYQPRVFSIDPPRVDRVLDKRLSWALDKIRTVGRLPNFPEGVSLNSVRLEQYIEMLLQSFSQSDQIVSFIDNMSNGNLRKALDFVVSFIGSGHVDSEKIFTIIEREGSYRLPLHEFLRAVIYGDNEHYDPSTSPVINVFDIANNDPKEHFLLLLLIAIVDRLGESGGTEGFVEISAVYEQLQKYGFTDRQIASSIDRGLKKSLITQPATEGATPQRLRVLSAGLYSIKALVPMFTYLDAIVIDTPLCESEAKKNINIVSTIDDRLLRALAFIDYLEKCWNSNFSDYLDFGALASKSRRELYAIQYTIRTHHP